ncbi:unnamed protein product [Hyaloperonospora brassicae]|uniref:Uncharacterized protein n=1 Tax=Hyaloperonospora brassicae TaxID=162125 RepID=A0AAV0UYK8_HYABA|nr:unnamed protein product [Hyaloperonospora brassicae]
MPTTMPMTTPELMLDALDVSEAGPSAADDEPELVVVVFTIPSGVGSPAEGTAGDDGVEPVGAADGGVPGGGAVGDSVGGAGGVPSDGFVELVASGTDGAGASSDDGASGALGVVAGGVGVLAGGVSGVVGGDGASGVVGGYLGGVLGGVLGVGDGGTSGGGVLGCSGEGVGVELGELSVGVDGGPCDGVDAGVLGPDSLPALPLSCKYRCTAETASCAWDVGVTHPARTAETSTSASFMAPLTCSSASECVQCIARECGAADGVEQIDDRVVARRRAEVEEEARTAEECGNGRRGFSLA